MKTLKPAQITPEPAAADVEGITFIDAATRRRCLWPLTGAGMLMIVCGDERLAGCPYCAPHKARSGSGTTWRADAT